MLMGVLPQHDAYISAIDFNILAYVHTLALRSEKFKYIKIDHNTPWHTYQTSQATKAVIQKIPANLLKE
jgi:hypothetical protein